MQFSLKRLLVATGMIAAGLGCVAFCQRTNFTTDPLWRGQLTAWLFFVAPMLIFGGVGTLFSRTWLGVGSGAAVLALFALAATINFVHSQPPTRQFANGNDYPKRPLVPIYNNCE